MSPQSAMTSPADPKHLSQGARAVDSNPVTLPLKGCALTADASGGIARVILEQRFENPHDVALTLTYKMPLPADAAVSGYSFDLGDRRIEGEVDRKKMARERYEEAIADGRSAALLEQARPDFFVQEIGNIAPKSTVTARLVLDQKLRWLDEGRWEWRFPLASAPRYLGPPGQTPDAGAVTLDVAEHGLPARATLALTIRDALTGQCSPESPSHAIQVDGGNVELGDGGHATLDRDVVVRWEIAGAEPGASIALARPTEGLDHAASAYGLVTLVPPTPRTKPRCMPRDLILLLDTSGSMHGMPLEQAKRVSSALVDSLQDDDRLEMVEFSSRPRRYLKKAQQATSAHKKQALAWLASLQAGGATEMVQGILEATKTLRAGAQRQIVLVTDGLIGFETELVKALSSTLPESCRLHTVGVGSSVNRSLLGPAARAGRGIEVILGLGEDPERACQRLLARTEAPLVVNVEIEGAVLQTTAPARVPDLYAGAPALVALELNPRGGELVVRGETADGAWSQRLTVPAIDHGDGNASIIKLFARERVEDIELDVATGEGSSRHDETIESLGVTFQIATRLTSWVAISNERTVDPLDPSRRVNVPQALSHGLSAEGLGLRPPQPAFAPQMQMIAAMPASMSAPAGSGGMRARRKAGRAGGPPPPPPAPGAPPPPPARSPAPPPPPAAAPAPPFDGPSGDAFDDHDAFAEDAELDEVELSAPEEQAPMKRSLMERVADKVTSWLGDDAVPAAEDRPTNYEAWIGRITLKKDGELVVEIDVESDFEWDPASFDAYLMGPGDSQRRITVVLARSTRAGRIAAGMTIRLIVLVGDAEADTSDGVELRLHRDDLTVDVRLAK